MTNPPDMTYSITLIAIFSAAFELGSDPYALALQAKLDLNKLLDLRPTFATQDAEQAINEALFVAKLIKEHRLTM